MSRVLRGRHPVRPTGPGTGMWRLVALCFLVLFALHISLLRLPYFWDEAGYFIPAARDLLLRGDLIPQSTLSNAHPPLVMIWLAAVWRLFGYSVVATRMAMLAVAALALAGVYRLARTVANAEVALGTTACTLLYPVFFAQSTMANLDMAAAALTLWGLLFYLRRRRLAAILLFALAALAKETAILTPVVLAAWETACAAGRRFLRDDEVWRHAAEPEPSRLAAFSRACLPVPESWARTRVPVAAAPAPGGVVCLSPRAHRLCVRQSGVLAL